MTIDEIKSELAVKNDTSPSKVRCYYCTHWGWNNYKAMDSCGGSKCLKRKEKTYSYQLCKSFEKIS